MKINLLSLFVILIFVASCSQTENEKKQSKTENTSGLDTNKNKPSPIPEVIEPPLIVQQECYYEKAKKPAKGGIDTRNWTHVIIEDGIRYEGKVCITCKDFKGSSPFNIPFVATIFGDISELYVNNKKVPFEEEGEIFFRQKISLENGYNRVPVKAVGKSGEKTEGYIEVNID
jgi:hypothetical protein